MPNFTMGDFLCVLKTGDSIILGKQLLGNRWDDVGVVYGMCLLHKDVLEFTSLSDY